ncbi:hypothetical protein F2Q70_00000397 [Brassica cretica]|uniref:Uncharacterized protein n=1 Tax=Brassica cretica TaxID=69181 RepID=A0A8S9J030_BRACR|nr:hypothetical protein F2Q70_00000397 [Brassica cretica]
MATDQENLLSDDYQETAAFCGCRYLCNFWWRRRGDGGWSATKEAIEMVYAFISSNPCGHPAKFLLERLVAKAVVPVASFLF